MVAELDITDQDVTKISEMIDAEIASLVPEWNRGDRNDTDVCQNCAASDGSVVELLSTKHCCGSVHGRFEEITYQVEESEQCVTDGAPLTSSQSDDVHYAEIWERHDHEAFNLSTSEDKHENIVENDACSIQDLPKTNTPEVEKDHENEIRQELRWLKARYQMQLRELRDQQLGILSKPSNSTSDNREFINDSEDIGIGIDKKVYSYEPAFGSCSPVHMATTAKSFYSGGLIPHSLHRASSLPVDATDC